MEYQLGGLRGGVWQGLVLWGGENSTQGVLKFSVANNFGVATNPIGFIFGTPNQGKAGFVSNNISTTQGMNGLEDFPVFINNASPYVLTNSANAVWTTPDLPAGIFFATDPQSGGNAGQVWAKLTTSANGPQTNTLNLQTFQTNTNVVNFIIANSAGVATSKIGFIIAPSQAVPSSAPAVNNDTITNNQYGWVYVQPTGNNLN